MFHGQAIVTFLSAETNWGREMIQQHSDGGRAHIVTGYDYEKMPILSAERRSCLIVFNVPRGILRVALLSDQETIVAIG